MLLARISSGERTDGTLLSGMILVAKPLQLCPYEGKSRGEL